MNFTIKILFVSFVSIVLAIGCGSSKEDQNIIYRGCGNSDYDLKLRDPVVIVYLNSLVEDTSFYSLAQIVGGIKSLHSAIKYPLNANRAGIEGIVYVLVNLDSFGSILDLKLLKGIGGGCDESAIDGIKKQSFLPSKRNGIAINDTLGIRITFKLQ